MVNEESDKLIVSTSRGDLIRVLRNGIFYVNRYRNYFDVENLNKRRNEKKLLQNNGFSTLEINLMFHPELVNKTETKKYIKL